MSVQVKGSGTIGGLDEGLNIVGVVTATSFSGALSGTTGTFSSTVQVTSGNLDIADSIRHVGDSNTKMRFPTADTISFETAGNERLRITSAGDLGLSNTGTNNPNNYSGWCTFTINGTSGAEIDFERGGSLQADILCGQNGLLYTNRLSGDYHAFQTHNGSSVGERLRIHSDGQVTIGNDHAGAGTLSGDLVVAKTNGGVIIAGDTGSGEYLHLEGGSGLGRIGTISNHDLVFITNGTSNERLRIDSNGFMGLGTNNPSSFNTYARDIVIARSSGDAGLTISAQDASSEYGSLHFSGGTTVRAYIDMQNGTTGRMFFMNKSNGYTAFGTSNTERLRIGSSGEVSLRRGGISATPSVEIFGSGNASDADADNLTIHNWGDSDGDYWRLGVNCGLNNSGNDSKPSNTLKGAGITIDGRYGRVFLKTSPSSSSTVHDALIVDSNGIVRTPLQPAFRSYTTSDGNSNGVVSGIWKTGADDKRKFDNNDDFNESNGRFTAPVDGVYQISVAWDELHSSATIIDVQINGGGGALDLYSTEQRSAGSGWNSWFTSSIAKLASGDYVTINLRNTSGTYPFHQNNGRWGHYSIYLIG